MINIRFKVIPRLIIYDNACNFYDTCMNRSPILFRRTLFISDRLHWANHRNCSAVFNPAKYGLVANTVLHESQNRRLGVLKKMTWRMLYETYVELLVNVIRHINLRPPISSQSMRILCIGQDAELNVPVFNK